MVQDPGSGGSEPAAKLGGQLQVCFSRVCSVI